MSTAHRHRAPGMLKHTLEGPAAVQAHVEPDREFMATLAKGLAVLRAFGEERPTMTLSEAAAAVNLSRATARRILRTLAELGYVAQQGRQFSLAPRVLELGFRFLSTQSWIERAEPLMTGLSEDLGESCSASVLQDTDIVYVAHVPTRRIMAASVTIGTRLPAFHTSMGRVQLGFLPDAEIWRRLRSVQVEAFTPSTIVDIGALFERVKQDRAQGFAIVDEELERGLRSISVPLLTRSGHNFAALNLNAHSHRTTRSELRERFLPRMRQVANALGGFAP